MFQFLNYYIDDIIDQNIFPQKKILCEKFHGHFLCLYATRKKKETEREFPHGGVRKKWKTDTPDKMSVIKI